MLPVSPPGRAGGSGRQAGGLPAGPGARLVGWEDTGVGLLGRDLTGGKRGSSGRGGARASSRGGCGGTTRVAVRPWGHASRQENGAACGCRPSGLVAGLGSAGSRRPPAAPRRLGRRRGGAAAPGGGRGGEVPPSSRRARCLSPAAAWGVPPGRCRPSGRGEREAVGSRREKARSPPSVFSSRSDSEVEAGALFLTAGDILRASGGLVREGAAETERSPLQNPAAAEAEWCRGRRVQRERAVRGVVFLNVPRATRAPVGVLISSAELLWKETGKKR